MNKVFNSIFIFFVSVVFCNNAYCMNGSSNPMRDTMAMDNSLSGLGIFGQSEESLSLASEFGQLPSMELLSATGENSLGMEIDQEDIQDSFFDVNQSVPSIGELPDLMQASDQELSKYMSDKEPAFEELSQEKTLQIGEGQPMEEAPKHSKTKNRPQPQLLAKKPKPVKKQKQTTPSASKSSNSSQKDDSTSLICPICKEKVKTRIKLIECSAKHADQDVFLCRRKNCDRSFRYLAVRTQHEKSKCKFVTEQLIDKSFSEPTELRLLTTEANKASFTRDNRDYECPYAGCDKKWTGLKPLLSHIAAHLSLKPYVCTKKNCNVSFGSTSALVSHLKKQHNIHTFQAKDNSDYKKIMEIVNAYQKTGTKISLPEGMEIDKGNSNVDEINASMADDFGDILAPNNSSLGATQMQMDSLAGSEQYAVSAKAVKLPMPLDPAALGPAPVDFNLRDHNGTSYALNRPQRKLLAKKWAKDSQAASNSSNSSQSLPSKKERLNLADPSLQSDESQPMQGIEGGVLNSGAASSRLAGAKRKRDDNGDSNADYPTKRRK